GAGIARAGSCSAHPACVTSPPVPATTMKYVVFRIRRAAVNFPDLSAFVVEPDRLSVASFGVSPANTGMDAPAAPLPATEIVPDSRAAFAFGSYFPVSVSLIGTSATALASTVAVEFAVPAPGVYGVNCARQM